MPARKRVQNLGSKNIIEIRLTVKQRFDVGQKKPPRFSLAVPLIDTCIVNGMIAYSVPARSPDLAGVPCRVGDPTGTERRIRKNVPFLMQNSITG